MKSRESSNELLLTLLWELFKAIIYGVLDQFEKIGKEVLKEIKKKIQEGIFA